MILIELMGGLGNQLFQIFCGISYAMENKINFKIIKTKTDYVSPLDNKSLRPTYFQNFLIYLSEFTCENINIITYREPIFIYKKIPISNNDFKINGYFQSPKYFEYNYENIIKLIKLDEKKREIKEKYYNFHKKTISLHFRIGDYIKNPKIHPVLDLNYYINAIKFILSHDNECKYILYFNEKDNNDIVEKMIHNLKNNFLEINFIQCDNNIEDWEQLLLMSVCYHNIIANSSFSWWGAYFNNNVNKLVCYPEKWFGIESNINTSDLFPKNWFKIES